MNISSRASVTSVGILCEFLQKNKVNGEKWSRSWADQGFFKGDGWHLGVAESMRFAPKCGKSRIGI